jgi:transposase
MTYEYKRNGTTDLFAALNIASGTVLTHCRKGARRHRRLGLFKRIDASVTRGLAIHVVLDNLSAHKAPEITSWLAHPRRKRWHLHFIPTSSSWVNLVERWFKGLTDKRLRRGVFTSVADLTAAIEQWVAHWNDDPKRLVWHALAAEIIEKVQRGQAALHQIKSTTDH